MNTTPAFIVSSGFVTVIIDGKSYTVTASNSRFKEAREAIKQKRFNDIPAMVDVATSINHYGAGKIVVKEGQITYNGEVVHNAIVDHIFRMRDEGFDIRPMVRFLDNLMQNPSKTSVDELYLFLEQGKMPITEDGHFLAYKRVRGNYFDIHSGKFDNRVGSICEMARNKVDDRRDNTCSYGLHFCSFDYLPHFSHHGTDDKIMIVKINPRDVVSIPSDYKNTKGRTSRYEVIGEHTGFHTDKTDILKTTSIVGKSYVSADESVSQYISESEPDVNVSISNTVMNVTAPTVNVTAPAVKQVDDLVVPARILNATWLTRFGRSLRAIAAMDKKQRDVSCSGKYISKIQSMSQDLAYILAVDDINEIADSMTKSSIINAAKSWISNADNNSYIADAIIYGRGHGLKISKFTIVDVIRQMYDKAVNEIANNVINNDKQKMFDDIQAIITKAIAATNGRDVTLHKLAVIRNQTIDAVNDFCRKNGFTNTKNANKITKYSTSVCKAISTNVNLFTTLSNYIADLRKKI